MVLSPQVYHLQLRPSKVLLDAALSPKLTGFGEEVRCVFGSAWLCVCLSRCQSAFVRSRASVGLGFRVLPLYLHTLACH